MKKLVLLGFIALMYGCMMIAQIPRQYVYVDENCEATLPDYSELVVVKDNCGEYILIQAPAPGEIISTETIVTITAIDAMGNMASAEFPVSVLDTIPPNLYYNDTMIVQLNPEWKGYTDQEVMDMYRTWFGWTQYNLMEFNRLYADTEIFIELPDTSFNDTLGEVRIFENTIDIPSSMDPSWWWASVE